jgi:hypothetical protein
MKKLVIKIYFSFKKDLGLEVFHPPLLCPFATLPLCHIATLPLLAKKYSWRTIVLFSILENVSWTKIWFCSQTLHLLFNKQTEKVLNESFLCEV